MVIMNDLEWPINAFILCDLMWKVQKSHAANREGSFKWCDENKGKNWYKSKKVMQRDS